MRNLREYKKRGLAVYAGARPMRRTVLMPILRGRHGNAAQADAQREAILAGKRAIQARLRAELGLGKR